jgi:hypothetical protein
VSVTPLGAGAVWHREGEPDLELGPGDLLSLDAEGQELARQGTRPRPSLARFSSWPEATTLFFATFESDVYGGERPQVVQGSVKEGYLSAVAGAPRKKVIELTLPPGVLVPAEAVVRLRFRTTGSRIQCAEGRSQSMSLSIRARSETVWTSMTLALKSAEPDGFQGGGSRARRNGRGNLLITVEGPARASDDMVFDVDQVEILRS